MNVASIYHPKHKISAGNVYLVTSFVVLALSTLYAGWHANLVYSNVQDATVYPYLFKGLHPHDIILPGSHPNILKFPLFWLQSLAPYNFATLTFVNLSLLFCTVFGWCFLLAYIFGKRNLPLIFIIMASILLGSVSLEMNLIETTIRNIEYPIGLAFILLVGRLLKNRPLSRKHQWVAMIIASLFSLSISGDNFMLFAFVTPILLALCIDWLRTSQLPRRVTTAFGLVVVVVVASAAIRKFVSLAGITYYPGPSTKVLPVDSFGPSLAHAASQVPDLFGATIFGQPVKMNNSIYFVNFVLLVIGLCGLVAILRWAFQLSCNKAANNKFSTDRFVLATLSLSFLTTIGSYILSGLAVVKLPDGTFTDASNTRYLSLIPFLLLPGILFVLARHHTARRPLLFIVAGVTMLSIVVSIPSIRKSSVGGDTFSTITQDNIQSTLAILRSNNITQIVSGDALAAPIRFWSHDKIQFASLASCNQYMHQNTRLSWRQTSPKPISTALIIDRVGADRAGLGLCSDEELRGQFGAPAKVEIPKQYSSQPTAFEVWIYHYDIRQKLNARE